MNLKTQEIPELSFLKTWIKYNQNIFEDILNSYKLIIESITTLTQDKISAITAARKLMINSDIKLHSASKLLSSDFIVNIQKNRQALGRVFTSAFNFDENIDVIEKLQKMLANGSKIAADWIWNKPKDWDKMWDEVIWWHTQAIEWVKKEVLVHFILSHYLCQYMNHHLWEKYDLWEKDDFINVLWDLILLEQSWKSEESSIYRVWSTKKQEWGLWWLDDKQLWAYKMNNIQS